MSNQLVVGVPAQVLDLVQQGAIERAFHDALYPVLGFRSEAMKEEWPAASGTEYVCTRPGLLPAVVKALVPGADPVPSQLSYEQWIATLAQYSGTVDTHMPTATVAAANTLMRNIHSLGLQAGQSVNRIARNALFQAYLSGSTVTTQAVAAIDTVIRVAALNGFTDVLATSNARPVPVSASAPLAVKIGVGGAAVIRNAIGFIPDSGADLLGPGQLILSAAVGSAFAGPRTPVVSTFAPKIVRISGGASVDSVAVGDKFTLQSVINAVALLRQANVPAHEDGFYHAHLSPLTNAQIFDDPVFQRLNQSLPEGMAYTQGALGSAAGVMFFMNNECPDTTNSGTLSTSALLGKYAPDLGSEIVNGAGTQIGRVIITGKGCMYEKFLDESQYMSEAGVNGKIAEFAVVNGNINVMTENVRLILQAPQDRLQQKVQTTWSISTSFSCPSDALASSGPERFKRAVIIEHSLG